MRSCFRLLVVAFAVPFTTNAETLVRSTAEAVLNAFIATYAKAEVAWKKDIRLNENPGQLEPGRQLGQSVSMGYYSFVPKAWTDLTPDQQRLVLQDSRLKAFLISTRSASAFSTAKIDQPFFPIEGAMVFRPKAPSPEPLPGKGPQATPVDQNSPPHASVTAGQSADRPPVLIKVPPSVIMKGDALKVEVPK